MERKPLIFATVLALGAAFAAVSLLVWLSRGNSKLVAKKLRLGALLIGLTGATTGCPIASCYDVAGDEVTLNDQTGTALAYDGTIRVFGAGDVVLTGRVEYRMAESFSFRVVRPAGSVVLSGPIEAADGAFDEETEELTLRFDASSLDPGDYKLEVMAGDQSPYTTRSYALIIYPSL